MTTLIIKNAAHDGYRRAGIALARGDNRHPLENFTEEQITALENDPNLVVAIEADDSEIELAGRLGEQIGTGANSPANHEEAAVAADEAPADGNSAAEAPATPAPAGDAAPVAATAAGSARRRRAGRAE